MKQLVGFRLMQMAWSTGPDASTVAETIRVASAAKLAAQSTPCLELAPQ